MLEEKASNRVQKKIGSPEFLWMTGGRRSKSLFNVVESCNDVRQRAENPREGPLLPLTFQEVLVRGTRGLLPRRFRHVRQMAVVATPLVRTAAAVVILAAASAATPGLVASHSPAVGGGS